MATRSSNWQLQASHVPSLIKNAPKVTTCDQVDTILYIYFSEYCNNKYLRPKTNLNERSSNREVLNLVGYYDFGLGYFSIQIHLKNLKIVFQNWET